MVHAKNYETRGFFSGHGVEANIEYTLLTVKFRCITDTDVP